MSDATRVALPVAAASAFSALAACVMVTNAGLWRSPAVDDLPADAMVGVAYAAAGAVVLAGREAARRVGWLLLLVGAAGAVAALSSALLATAPAGSVTASVAAGFDNWVWVVAFGPMITLLPLLYPTGLPPTRRWRWTVPVAVVAMVLMAVGAGLLPPQPGETGPARPLTWAGAPGVFAVGLALLVVSASAGLVALLARVRRSTGLVRRQVVVFLVAAGILLLDTALQPVLPSPVDHLSQAAAVAMLPVAVAVAVTRLRLYELDAAVRRGVVAVSLAVCLAAGFAVLQTLFDTVLVTGAATALAAAATGLAVYPLVTSLSAGADRWIGGGRVDPAAVLADLARRTGDEVDPRRRAQALCDALLAAPGVGAVELRLDGAEPFAWSGTADAAAPLELALRHAGEEVGRLVVHAAERELDVRDAEQLCAVADQVAPGVATIRLFDQLRRSRETVVVAREEERRRLRRDLHDDVGATLAGVRLQLDAARDLATDPAVAGILERAGRGVAEAVADVRRVTEDLQPAALDELGLAGSLAALAQRWTDTGLRVDLDVATLPEVPAATEVACFRLAAEALANAARHSGATTIRVVVAPEVSRLVLCVVDDGRGIAAQAAAGVGLASMRQRAEEIGGTLSVTTSAEGTTIRAELPG